jgi:hypothetical protein
MKYSALVCQTNHISRILVKTARSWMAKCDSFGVTVSVPWHGKLNTFLATFTSSDTSVTQVLKGLSARMRIRRNTHTVDGLWKHMGRNILVVKNILNHSLSFHDDEIKIYLKTKISNTVL